MSRQRSTDSEDMSIRKAEREVQNNLNRFEVAMEHLADKVEGPGQKLHKVQEFARRSRQRVKQVQDVIQGATASLQANVAAPLAPRIQKASDVASTGALQQSPDPKHYAWAAIGIVGGLIALMYLRRKNSWAGNVATQVVRRSARKFLFI
ncbi:MAG: hypothetical protein ACK5Y2_04505 [Bdellovibrionales bacterium]